MQHDWFEIFLPPDIRYQIKEAVFLKMLRSARGAAYYEMATGQDRFVFNPRYGARLPLRRVRASDLCQLPELKGKVTYQAIRDRLPELKFLTDPELFPESARL